MTISAPKGCAWDGARVEVITTPAGKKQGEFGPERTVARVEHVLILARGGVETRLVLERAEESEPAYKPMRKQSYTLAFAPDGHALAISIDKGASWGYVALDAGDAPLFCRHVMWKGSGDAMWTSAPTTRALALEILGSSTRPGVATGRNHADLFELETGDARLDDLKFSSGPGASDIRFVQELRGALRWAALHADETLVRFAVIDALERPGRQLHREEPTVVEVAGRLAAAHADVRTRVVKQLRGDRWDRAALVLSRVPEAEVQEALAERLTDAYRSTPSDALCDRIALYSWSLARATLARRAASPSVMKTIAQIARTPSPCPPRQTLAVKEVVSGRGQSSRRFMITALAAVGTPEARAVIAELAAGPCRSYNNIGGIESVLRESQPPPKWSLELKPFSQELVTDSGGVRLDIACWARAALASLPEK